MRNKETHFVDGIYHLEIDERGMKLNRISAILSEKEGMQISSAEEEIYLKSAETYIKRLVEKTNKKITEKSEILCKKQNS